MDASVKKCPGREVAGYGWKRRSFVGAGWQDKFYACGVRAESNFLLFHLTPPVFLTTSIVRRCGRTASLLADRSSLIAVQGVVGPCSVGVL